MKRKLSLLLTIIAWIVVPLLAYLRGEAEARELLAHGNACGMPILGLYMAALFLSGLISAVALVLGVLAYRKLARPRPMVRVLELAVVGLPLLLALVVVVGLVVTGG
ncbi:hypothetical protein [Dyella silvae]|uniref:hypothetical protein n=1 Tax=Dyella silvae TaxID=2994424 RepID=UPI0022648891|nr:hypothetical protein [Dyella silvae]